MIWRRSDNKATVAAVCALAVAAGGAAAMRAAKQQGGPGGGLARAVLTDKEAFLLGPPELIAGSEAGKVFPSPDGRYVLAVRTRHDGLPTRITAADLDQNALAASPPETSVILWDSQTRKSSIIWKAGGGSLAGQFTMGTLQQAVWLPSTTNALLTVSTMRGTAGTSDPAANRTSLLLYSAATGTTRNLLTSPNGARNPLQAIPGDISIIASRTQPVASIGGGIINAQGTVTSVVRVLRRNGTLGPVVELPKSTYLAGFSRDGTQVYFETEGAYDKATKKRAPSTYFALSVNGTSGALVPLDKQPQVVAVQGDEYNASPASPSDGDALPVRLAAAPATLTRAQSRQNVRPVWLERTDEPAATPPVPAAVTNKPAPAKTTPALLLAAADSEPLRALVTADCDDAPLTTGQTFQQARSRWPNGTPVLSVNGALLLPDASAILYRASGALYAVPILRMDKATFLEARRRAQRLVVISNARQLGTGLMMYTQDYDEVIPSGENINDKITPYVRNDSLFQNFTYTFGGGPMAAIDQPAITIIGYVTGPGGRANIFADGHVKWQDE